MSTALKPALKVARASFEPSNCEHHAILRQAHHLCKIGTGRGRKLQPPSWLRQPPEWPRHLQLDEAVRLSLESVHHSIFDNGTPLRSLV
jgi:hypothetical protein